MMIEDGLQSPQQRFLLQIVRGDQEHRLAETTRRRARRQEAPHEGSGNHVTTSRIMRRCPCHGQKWADDARQGCSCPVLKDVARREDEALAPGIAHETNRLDAVATELEEAVVDADAGNAKSFGKK